MEAKNVGLPADFVIFDEEDCKSLLKTIITNRDLSKIVTPSALLMTFDKTKAKADQSSLLLEGYDGHDLETPLSQEIYKAYSKELLNRHALDFSDLIYYVRAALANMLDIRQKWSQRFKFIQVDEIQDTHMAEYEVIHTLAAEKNIAAFGDLDQSIYGWRGAEPTKVRDRFIKDFSPEIFNLPYNYRATKALIQAADSFAGRAFEERHNELIPDESCPDGDTIVVHHALNEDGESTWIEEQIHVLTSKNEQQFKDIAVICRTNQKAKQIASVLEDQDIPCLTVDQYHFFRRQEIKDALAILKLLINPYDVSSAHRIALSSLKGVGKATVSRILNEGAGIGLRLTDFFNKETFDNQEPFGRLVQAYGQGLLTVIDAETTGINPVADNIIELAYCTLDAGRKSQRWSSLVRSDKPVGSSVHVHGITDEKLNSEGIPPEDGLNKLFNDILFGLVVGHNVSFDLATIRSQAGRVGLDVPKSFLGHKFSADTCEIARRFIDVKSYRLEDLCDELNLPRRESHRAMGDVDNTVELLGHLMPYVKKHQSERIEFVQRYRHFFEPAANIFNTIHSFAHNNRPGDVLNKALELFNMVNVYEQEPHRVDNLNYLVSLFHEQDRKNLSPWDSLHTLVQFASLSKSLDHLSENENKVIVAPIHQSKGLEFSSVFIAGAVDGFMPIFNSQDIEEEKRLFYVAMTRPRKNLFITGFKEYVTKKGFVVQKSMTPFMEFIDGRLLEPSKPETSKKSTTEVIRIKIDNNINLHPSDVESFCKPKQKKIGLIHSFEILGTIRCLSVFPSNYIAYCVNFDNNINILNFNTGKVDISFAGHKDSVYTLSSSHNGKYLLSGGNDAVKLWCMESKKNLWSGAQNPVASINFTHNDTLAVLGSYKPYADCNLFLFDINRLTIKSFKEKSSFFMSLIYKYKVNASKTLSCVFTKCEKYILAAQSGIHFDDNSNISFSLWSIDSGNMISKYKSQINASDFLCLANDGEHALLKNKNEDLLMWNIKSNSVSKQFINNKSCVNSAIFSHNFNFVASSHDDTVKLWDIDSGKLIWMSENNSKLTDNIAFSFDDRYLVTGESSRYLRLNNPVRQKNHKLCVWDIHEILNNRNKLNNYQHTNADPFEDIFHNKNRDDFNINQAAKMSLDRISTCTRYVAVIFPKFNEISYNCIMIVDSTNLLAWSKKLSKSWSSDKEIEVGKIVLSAWLDNARLDDNSISYVPKFIYNILEPYSLDFLKEGFAMIFCLECREFVSHINYTSISSDSNIDKKYGGWFSFTTIWECPIKHMLYQQDHDIHI